MASVSKLVRAAGLLLFSAFLFSAAPALAIDFGDDTSQWANDGECDDPRFEGPGMTATPLLESDILHDATDCKQAFDAGRITFKKPGGKDAEAPGIDFGDDASQWANDGECDDPRFEGAGMTATTLLESDIGRDATDCRTAYEAGRLTIK